MCNSKKHLRKFFILCGLMFCVYFPYLNIGSIFSSVQTVISSWFPSDDEYKLKFVSVGIDAEQTIAGHIEVLMPVEVLAMRQSGEMIAIETNPQAVVACPISSVVSVSASDKIVKIEKYGYTLEMLGFAVVGVQDRDFVKVGHALGTLSTNILYVKVTKDGRVLTLADLGGFVQ